MAKTPSHCKYFSKYYDPQKKSRVDFYCKEPIYKDHHCKFHNPNFLTLNKASLIIDEINKKLFEPNDVDLLCIGYIIPELTISDKIISKRVFFSKTEFKGKVIFSNVIFKKYCSFSKCEFEDKINFSNSIFEGNVDIIDANMNGEFSSFSQVIFKKELDFINCKISNGEFHMCNFNESTFENTTFNKKTTFWFSDFKGETTFDYCTFLDSVNFSHSIFTKSANFERNTFKGKANFKKIYFKHPELIFFDDNLTNASFIETNITRIVFGNQVIWNDEKIDGNNFFTRSKIFNYFLNRNRKYIIYDERNLEKKIQTNIKLENIIDIYRNLRDNFDYNLRYESAGSFFVREMELKRKYKNKENNIITHNIIRNKLSFLAIYHLVSQYGESHHRPIVLLIPILLFSTFYFFTSGFKFFEIFTNCNFSMLLGSSFKRSLTAFFPFYGFSNYNNLSDYTLRASLLPVLGAYIFAIGRKFGRRFRH